MSFDFPVTAGWGASLSSAVPWDPSELCQLTTDLLRDNDEGVARFHDNQAALGAPVSEPVPYG